MRTFEFYFGYKNQGRWIIRVDANSYDEATVKAKDEFINSLFPITDAHEVFNSSVENDSKRP